MKSLAPQERHQPYVSIVMPTLNAEAFINDALHSLRRQTLQNYELLICDSSSSDSTLEILKHASDIPIRIVSRNDTSVPDALNKGFASARGRVLCWLNSDDVFLSSKTLQKVANTFSSNSIHVAIGDCATLDVSGYITRRLYTYLPVAHLPQSGGNIFTGSLFFSEHAWKSFGGFSCKYKYAFEYELTAALFHCYDIAYINEIIGGFRIHPNGLSSAFSCHLSSEKEKIYTSHGLTSSKSNLFTRMYALCKQRSILKAIVHRFHDPYVGRPWLDIP